MLGMLLAGVFAGYWLHAYQSEKKQAQKTENAAPITYSDFPSDSERDLIRFHLTTFQKGYLAGAEFGVSVQGLGWSNTERLITNSWAKAGLLH